jgi:serine/threonine protein kinase
VSAGPSCDSRAVETLERIGPYVVLSLIARGGMGEVWRARHPTLSRDVAVKLVRADLHGRPAMREMFEREVQVLARLRSPQTVQVIDAGVTPEGLPYIVTEFLEGEDLAAHVRQRGALPVEEAVEIAIGVLESLAEAHAMDLVHRDIKPANVFLQRLPGGGRAVKVLDFGVAKLLSADESLIEETVGGGPSMKGSPRYMAPEQIRGRGLSPRTDLYAVGGVLYFMISGEHVFNAAGRDALLSAHLNETPVPLRERCPLYPVPAGIEALVLQCLRKSPEERPWGARELIAALGRAVSAPEPAFAEPLGALPPAGSSETVPFLFEEPLTATAAPAGFRQPSGPALDTEVDPHEVTFGSDADSRPDPAAAPMPTVGATAPTASNLADLHEDMLELADVPRRPTRAFSTPAPGTGRPAVAPIGRLTGSPAGAVARDDDGPELQLAIDPRSIAETQRRTVEVQANRVRRATTARTRNTFAARLATGLAVAALAVVGFALYRSFTARHTEAPPAPAPASRTLGARPARFAEVIAEAPPVARRQTALAGRGPDQVTIGVATGTANFIRVDTGEQICTDAVECPMPLGVGIKVQRAGGKPTLLPPMTRDQAAAGVIHVDLPK